MEKNQLTDVNSDPEELQSSGEESIGFNIEHRDPEELQSSEEESIGFNIVHHDPEEL